MEFDSDKGEELITEAENTTAPPPTDVYHLKPVRISFESQVCNSILPETVVENDYFLSQF